MGFNVNDLSTSKYLKKEDVGEGVVATVTGARKEDVSMQDQPAEMKWLLLLDGKDLSGEPLKPLVMNKTNGILMQAITGKGNSDDWVGTQIVLWNDPSVIFGNNVGGTRVKKYSADPGRQIPTTPVSEDGPPVASEADLAHNEEIPFEPKY